MSARQVLQTGRVPVHIWTEHVEETALQQLSNIAQLPVVYGHVAVMPDVHMGMGATIGSVIPTRGAVIPSAVGVDIGCGMAAVRIDLDSHALPENLKEVRKAIERAVPHGRTSHGGRNDRGAWRDAPKEVMRHWRAMDPERELAGVLSRFPKLVTERTNTWRHLGTLGTGNHFVEICLDEADDVWVMLHSGSRGVGNRIGQFFIEQARQEMSRRGIDLPDKDLGWLEEGSVVFEDYVAAVGWAQNYAATNRRLMMDAVLDALRRALGRPLKTTAKAINCHHNYVAREQHFGEDLWVTRKGAIRAGDGELGIIPGSMGARSFIVRGKGSAESLQSCSHGAGRRMSRTEARRRFDVDDLVSQTAGIECRKDDGVVDEIPGAYKDIDQVMADQSDLVEVVHTLRQIVNVKG